MSETRHAARLGFGRKLYSAKGTLLGTVNYPYHWDELIQERRGAKFRFPMALRLLPIGTPPDLTATVRTFSIVPAYPDRAGVVLFDISLEEFEQIDGCAFQPGAGYMRSLVE